MEQTIARTFNQHSAPGQRRPESMNSPIRFIPHLRPMVWGGRRLEKVLGKTLPTEGRYGESWEISDHPLHRSVLAQHTTNLSLRDLMERDPAALLGASAHEHGTFPWLVKFLDACDWLSVQVHPDTAAVRRLWPGEGSKTEAWFILAAEPGSRIYAGLKPGAGEAELRAALRAGTVAECLHQFEPRAGDCVFLPAGTVHAVGGGVLMAEVQQTSDATFRLFDWNRRDAQGKTRELHIEQALASVDWSRGPVEPIRVPGFENPASASLRVPLVHCAHFKLEYRWETQPFPCGGNKELEVIIVLQGQGRLLTADGEQGLQAGQTWMLPAALPRTQCQPAPAVGFLVCTLPSP
jgi:mannose-6-phosphate isomerase